MNWCHSVDRAWLTARKQHVTASDIKKLLPVTATGKPRANLLEAYMKVWAEKQAAVTEEDVMSYGVMARGHLFERYAVMAFNELGGSYPTLYHWDDSLIFSPDGVSCSPDALTLKQPGGCPTQWAGLTGVTAMGEIKCFGAAGHYTAGMSPKMLLEERWQIATAMYTMVDIEYGYLILFNPNTKHPLFVHTYSRTELAKELKMIEETAKNYWAKAEILDLQADSDAMKVDCMVEQEIIAELMDEASGWGTGLNP